MGGGLMDMNFGVWFWMSLWTNLFPRKSGDSLEFNLLARKSGESLELNLPALRFGEQGADVVRPNKK